MSLEYSRFHYVVSIICVHLCVSGCVRVCEPTVNVVKE